MVAVVASALLAALLLASAAAKAADRPGTLVALSTYGLRGRAAPAAWALLVGAEALVGTALLAGAPGAGWAAGALFAVFAAGQAGALAADRGGAPCGCLGSTGRLSWGGAGRTAALALGAALVAAAAPAGAPAPVAAGVAVAAPAAGWGIVRRARRAAVPQGALELAGEGPPLGEPAALAEWMPAGDGRVRLAVFTSPACRLCRALEPALRRLATDDRVVLRTFDEERDAEAWRAAAVPGAPFAVALGEGGVALAKGTVNTETQLHSVLAAAEARRGALPAGAPDGDSRRDFLARAAGAAATAAAAPTIGALVAPGEAGAYHFCGHIYTTDSCPHPTGLPRVDSRGRPLRAKDGKRVDDLGRHVDSKGRPLDRRGKLLRDPDGRPLPPAPRTPLCDQVAERYGFRTWVDGAWYRCCGGRVRKLWDCCSYSRRRINGDRSLTGYCYRGRKVFCVMYYQTSVPC